MKKIVSKSNAMATGAERPCPPEAQPKHGTGMQDPTDEEMEKLPWDCFWEAQVRVNMFRDSMFAKRKRKIGFKFRAKDLIDTCAFWDSERYDPQHTPTNNLGRRLYADLPQDAARKRHLMNRLWAAARVVAATATASLTKVEFDFTTLREPLTENCIEAEFEWLTFKYAVLRGIEKEHGLAQGETTLILNALATTPVYAGSKANETFLEVVPAAEVSGGERYDVCARLRRKCDSLLYMLNATGPWCDACGHGMKVATCRCCGDRYLLDGALLFWCWLQLKDQGWETWVYPNYECWKCLKAQNTDPCKVLE